MASLSEPANAGWLFPFRPQDWEQTPPAVQAYLGTVRDEVEQLQGRVETLEARLRLSRSNGAITQSFALLLLSKGQGYAQYAAHGR
jgi:hypothetical protein